MQVAICRRAELSRWRVICCSEKLRKTITKSGEESVKEMYHVAKRRKFVFDSRADWQPLLANTIIQLVQGVWSAPAVTDPRYSNWKVPLQTVTLIGYIMVEHLLLLAFPGKRTRLFHGLELTQCDLKKILKTHYMRYNINYMYSVFTLDMPVPIVFCNNIGGSKKCHGQLACEKTLGFLGQKHSMSTKNPFLSFNTQTLACEGTLFFLG